MNEVKPSVFLVGETRIIPEGFNAFLAAIGVPHWVTDAKSESEVIVEAAGKLCYMSFDTSLNKNLTRTGTRNNEQYIQQGLLKTKHGSVLEHTTVNVIFKDVSRVLTHELIRHRPGAAYSQVSGRYVRGEEQDFYIPQCIEQEPRLKEVFIEAVKHSEAAIDELCRISGIDSMTDFTMKKELTSAFRRIAGNGAASHIMATYNHRALRHLLAVRTAPGAEEEIRYAFGTELFPQLKARYPAIYADASTYDHEGIPVVLFEHDKV